MSASHQTRSVKSLQTKLWMSHLFYQYKVGKREVLSKCKSDFRKAMIDGWCSGDVVTTDSSVDTMEYFFAGTAEPYQLPLMRFLQSGPVTEKAALKLLRRYCPAGAASLNDLQFPPLNGFPPLKAFRYSELEELDWSVGFYEQCLAARGDIHALTVCLALALVSEYTRNFVDQHEGYSGLCWALPPVLAIPWVWPHRNHFMRCVFDALSIEEASGGIFCSCIQWSNIEHHASMWKRKPLAYRKRWPTIVRLRSSDNYPAFTHPEKAH